MAKTRPILEKTQYQWYDWFVNCIPESIKKSESNTKQKVMMFIDSKIENKTQTINQK